MHMYGAKRSCRILRTQRTVIRTTVCNIDYLKTIEEIVQIIVNVENVVIVAIKSPSDIFGAKAKFVCEEGTMLDN